MRHFGSVEPARRIDLFKIRGGFQARIELPLHRLHSADHEDFEPVLRDLLDVPDEVGSSAYAVANCVFRAGTIYPNRLSGGIFSFGFPIDCVDLFHLLGHASSGCVALRLRRRHIELAQYGERRARSLDGNLVRQGCDHLNTLVFAVVAEVRSTGSDQPFERLWGTIAVIEYLPGGLIAQLRDVNRNGASE